MNNKVDCRCCEPPQKFYDYSGRSKHEKSMKKSSALTSNNLKQIPVAIPLKRDASYDTRSNANFGNGIIVVLIDYCGDGFGDRINRSFFIKLNA